MIQVIGGPNLRSRGLKKIRKKLRKKLASPWPLPLDREFERQTALFVCSKKSLKK